MAKDATYFKVLVELGGVLYDYEQLTDDGDHIRFEVATPGRLFSQVQAQKPLIRPDGVLTGLEVTPDDAEVDNTVDVGTGTAWINGALVTLAAADEAVAVRGTAPNIYKIDSITLTSGGAVAVVEGTGSTAFSETRGAAGGPPLIPTTSIELAQVRMSAEAAAAIAASEIYSVPNQHRELASYPVYTVYPIGDSDCKGTAFVEFSEALPLIHTGAVAKEVHARYTNPNFATISECSDFAMPRDSFSQSEDATNDGPRAAVKLGRGTGSFGCLHDGTGSAVIMQVKGTQRMLKFYPDKYLTGYWLMEATLAIVDNYPIGANIKATVTLGAKSEPLWIQP